MEIERHFLWSTRRLDENIYAQSVISQAYSPRIWCISRREASAVVISIFQKEDTVFEQLPSVELFFGAKSRVLQRPWGSILSNERNYFGSANSPFPLTKLGSVISPPLEPPSDRGLELFCSVPDPIRAFVTLFSTQDDSVILATKLSYSTLLTA